MVPVRDRRGSPKSGMASACLAFLPQAGPVTLTATAGGEHDQEQRPEFLLTTPAGVFRARPPRCARVVRVRDGSSRAADRPGRSFRRRPHVGRPPRARAASHAGHARRRPGRSAVDRPDNRCFPPLGGRGERAAPISPRQVRAPLPRHSPRWPAPHRGYSPRLGRTHHATHHAVVSGPGHRLRPRPAPTPAGLWPWPRPAGPSGPLPGLQRGVAKGVALEVAEGVAQQWLRRGARSSWAASPVSPGQALVSVW